MSDTALHDRYAGEIPHPILPANAVIGLLHRHRSVRRFTEEGVDEATVAAIVSAAQSAATSSNLQSWSVVAVRDPERRARVAELAGQQDFIAAAPVVLVFVADWARHRVIAERHDQGSEGIDFIESTLVGFVDAALAAQNAVVAAESLGLGTVYVGSVRNRPEELADLLGLPAAAFPVVGVVLGHPDPADTAGVKPRLPQHVVLHRERYAEPEESALQGYDAAVRGYYAGQGEQRGWLEAVLRRVRDAASLHGRHTIRGALVRRGLLSR